MTETEKRRTELLQQTRQLYSEKYAPPAIHPRYQNVYQSLYKDENRARPRNSFGVRLLVAILIFGLFLCANEFEMQQVETVTNEIAKDVWNDVLEKGD